MPPFARTLIVIVLTGMLAGCSDSAQEQASAKPLDEAAVKEFEAYKAKAEQGDAEAQNMVGRCYTSRIGVERDYVEAVAWYRKAAEQGLAVAQYNLGLCYDKGTGVPWTNRKDSIGTWRKIGIYFEERKGRRGESTTRNIDEIEAYAYYKIASISYEQARERLEELESSMSEERLETAKKRAEELQNLTRLRIAADRGDAEAQTDLGTCYSNGTGVTKNQVQAVYWFRKAAEKGYAKAQYSLGLCYERGVGVPEDKDRFKKYIKNPGQDQQDAQKNIFKLPDKFNAGTESASRNIIEAYALYSLASLELETAREKLETFSRNISKTEIELGKKRAEELSRKIEANSPGK